jgi:hypothetical protein
VGRRQDVFPEEFRPGRGGGAGAEHPHASKVGTLMVDETVYQLTFKTSIGRRSSGPDWKRGELGPPKMLCSQQDEGGGLCNKVPGAMFSGGG